MYYLVKHCYNYYTLCEKQRHKQISKLRLLFEQEEATININADYNFAYGVEIEKANIEDENDEEEYKAIFEGLELGTEATRTGIIDNARKSGYIELKKDVYTILPGGRFLIESLRTDSLMLGSFKMAQIVSIVMFLLGLGLFIYMMTRSRFEYRYNDEDTVIDGVKN